MKMVPDWKKAGSWLSVQLSTIGGVAAGAWLVVPPDLRDAVPQEWLASGACVMFALVVLGRIVDQS
jgi:hypothetical protein